MDLVKALPPVVTGIENSFERWETLQTVEQGAKSGLSRSNGDLNDRSEQLGQLKGKGACGDILSCVNFYSASMSTEEVSSQAQGGVEARTAIEGVVDTISLERRKTSTGTKTEVSGGIPPPGVGLTRLCRRAVILLTRSPTCPDLVKRQTGPAIQKTYDQMEPLLVKANISYGDLYPVSVSFETRRDNSVVEW